LTKIGKVEKINKKLKCYGLQGMRSPACRSECDWFKKKKKSWLHHVHSWVHLIWAVAHEQNLKLYDKTLERSPVFKLLGLWFDEKW